MKSIISRICDSIRWRTRAIARDCSDRWYCLNRERYVSQVKRKEQINVVFLCMNVAMWKSQHLYDLLKKDSRFKLYVFLTPATTFSYASRCEDMKEMRSYFRNHNVPFVDYELEKGQSAVSIKSLIDPDILFYAQPYPGVVDACNDFDNFRDKLLCHIPYGFSSRSSDHYNYDLRFNNLAWKLYYQTEESKELARRFARNRGKNAVVVGYPSADDYVLPAQNDPWKVKDRKVKRIIWAPHFTILKGLGFSQISNFLTMADYMRKLSVDYSDKITIAFKPHPRLYSELVKIPDWGEERTKEYYDFWKNNPTTQLETGDFVDLFKESDAMLHDSGSFAVDYLYFNKPVLYDNPDVESAKTTANEIGKKAYDMHYRVSSNDDITRFIDDVVLAGNDMMKAQREEFYRTFLRPPHGKTVAQNIYDDLMNSLKIE